MRVLFVSASMRTGGAERVIVLLAHALARDDEVAVVAAPGELDAELPAGARHVFADRGRSPAGLVSAGVAVARAVRATRPDVVHAHNVRASALAVAGARLAHPLAPPPVVATHHGVRGEDDGGARRVFRHVAAVAAVSADLARRLGDVAAVTPVSVIPNAVSPAPPLDDATRATIDAELGLGAGPVVASISRLVPEKALGVLLDAFAEVRAGLPAATLLIVGDGPERGALEERAGALGLAGSVRFCGLRPDARLLLARADVLALSSVSEGQPIVALEALAAGVPVVSTAVGGMPALLAGGTGVLVAPQDPGALARGLGEALSDSAARARMAQAGRRLVAAEHDPAATVAAYRSLYASVLT